MRNSFVMYTEWLEQIEILTVTQRGTLFSAIIRYAAAQDLPEMDPVTKMAFSFIRAQIDRDAAKYEEIIEKRRQAGKARAEQMLAHAESAQHNQQTVAHEGVDVDVNDDVDVDVNVDVDVKKEKRKRFTPPTLEELRSYIREKGYTFDAETFIAYYESNGWKIGRNPMKDWKAACRTWQQKEKERRKPAVQQVEPRAYDMDELEAAIYRAQSAAV